MKELVKILFDDIDKEILDKMPEWFRILRNAHDRSRLFSR